MTAILASALIRMKTAGESSVPDGVRRLLPLPGGLARGATARPPKRSVVAAIGSAFVRLLGVGIVTLLFINMVADLVRGALGDGTSAKGGDVLPFPDLKEVQ